jgi:adenylosuccinate synthase
MSGIVIVGAQWGDEGKGKIVDILSRDASLVVRYGGGSNAGHTVVIGDQVIKLHQVPSGIIHRGVRAVLGNGMVVHPPALVEEMTTLEDAGYDTTALTISGSAHVVMPYHRLLDGLEEESRGAHAIGTTKRGIGPTYTDKVARHGIRMADTLDMGMFAEKVETALERINAVLSRLYGHAGLSADEIVAEYEPSLRRLAPYVADTSLLINMALEGDQTVIFEGAQGTFLDLDHGTYPYVTSSTSTAGGACYGAGIGPGHISEVWGVVKAYTTRVGRGPFPTELSDETGDYLVERGQEYGTTTGRRRRCGWLDGMLLRYAKRVNGLTRLAITKLDVLTGLPTLRVCVGYRFGSKRIEEYLPPGMSLEEAEPMYEELPGWEEPFGDASAVDDLPKAARDYLSFIEDYVGVAARVVSVGPRREQTVFVAS